MDFSSRFVGGWLVAIGILSAASACMADVLSDNLSNAIDGTDDTTNVDWYAVRFGTGSSSYNSITAKLLIGWDGGHQGVAQVSLYSDVDTKPGNALADLTLQGSIINGLAPTTFTTSSVSLDANTNYWIVPKAMDWPMQWAWTTDNLGVGAGFLHTWGHHTDSGWSTLNAEPYLAQISATTVPEPTGMALISFGGAALVALRRKLA
jgi:hypothetical protein